MRVKKKPRPVRVYYPNPKSGCVEVHEVKSNTNKRSERYLVVQSHFLPLPNITPQTQEIVARKVTETPQTQEKVAREAIGTTSRQDGSDVLDFSLDFGSQCECNDDMFEDGTNVSPWPFL